jgi:hypothetical protein
LFNVGLCAYLGAAHGHPTRDIAALHRVKFVMKGGMAYLTPATAR